MPVIQKLYWAIKYAQILPNSTFMQKLFFWIVAGWRKPARTHRVWLAHLHAKAALLNKHS